MPIVAANGINIAYDEVGDAKAPVILLIMGLGTQMIAWPEAFCLALARLGFRVVRFDNRDIGLSTKFETAAPIDLAAAFARAMARKSVDATPLHTRGHGGGCHRPHGRARHRQCPRGRRLDGRDDRPDHRGQVRKSHAELDVDHVVERRHRPAAG